MEIDIEKGKDILGIKGYNIANKIPNISNKIKDKNGWQVR